MTALLERFTRQLLPARADLARILYVEDDEIIRRLSESVLTRAGYAVTVVADGLEAWEALVSDSFDLVVTDHDMPRLTGMELAVKARLQGLTVPFIVASGSTGKFASAENQWLRLAATLPKPFGADELIAIVRQVLGAASSARWEARDFPPAMVEGPRHTEHYPHWGINE